MKTTLDELQAFTHVVDAGSISAAAEQLGQTASGISRALGRLEDKLGVTLLRRTTRRCSIFSVKPMKMACSAARVSRL